MRLNGDAAIGANQESLWKALHDLELLSECVPGCEHLIWIDQETVEAQMVLRIGALKRRYRGRVRIADSMPPRSYRLLFGEKGRSSTVTTEISLIPIDQNNTKISYEVDAHLDSFLGKLGTRMPVAIARKLAAIFFTRLDQTLTAGTLSQQ